MYYVKTRADNSGYTNHRVTCLIAMGFPFDSEQQPFSQKFVTIVLTFSLKIILRQFLSPFHKDYLTTNFNLTTKITLTIKILPQVYSIQHYVIKFVSDLRQVNGFLRVLQFSPPIKLTDILLKGALNTINHLPQQPSFISIAQQNIFLNKIIL